MTFFPSINKWFIPFAALEESRRDMANQGKKGNEATCLWLGTKSDGQAHISHIVLLRGDGIECRPQNVIISPDLLSDIHDRAIDLELVLIGQIHTHGPFYGTDLSPVDHRYGIRAPYFLSIVCPDYGKRESTLITECGIHVYFPDRGYRRLSSSEIDRRISMTGESVHVLTIGG